MLVHYAKMQLRTVLDVYTDRALGGGREVFAVVAGLDGPAEIYGYVGCGDDAELHAFADEADAAVVIANVRSAGCINVAEFPGHWTFIV